MPWDTSQERTVRVRFPGGARQVRETAPFAATINSLLRESGTATAYVFTRRSGRDDFEEVTPQNAPQNFAGIEEVEIRTYLKAG